MTDNIMFIPAIVVLVLEAVAFIFLTVNFVKDCKKAKEEKDEN